MTRGRPVSSLAACLLVAACSPADRPSLTPPPSLPGSPPGGTGSVTDQTRVGCADGIGDDPGSPVPEDFVIGPLRYSAAGAWAAMRPPEGVRQPDGWYFYKTGAVVRPGVTATAAVASEARAYAAIVVGGGPDTGSSAVTYTACPRPPDTVWPGGFLLTRRTACLPLDVTVAGRPGTRRVVLSVYHGRCR